MASTTSLSTPNLPRLTFSSSSSSSSSSRRHLSVPYSFNRALVVRAKSQQPLQVASEVGPTQENDKDSAAAGSDPKKPNFSPLNSIPSWAKWFLGSVFFVAIPFYKKFLLIEDKLEKTAVMVADRVEEVAEMTEKIADEVSNSLPEGNKLKELAEKVERIAEVVDKDAEAAEALVKKVDEVVDKVDAMVEPIIGGDILLGGNKPHKGTGSN